MVEIEVTETRGTGPIMVGGWPLGSILQLAQLVAILAGLIYWFASNAEHSSSTEQRLSDLQSSVVSQIGDLRNQITNGNADLRSQITNLPDIRARMDANDRRFQDHEKTMASLDARIATLERSLIQLQADYNAVARASAIPLKGR